MAHTRRGPPPPPPLALFFALALAVAELGSPAAALRHAAGYVETGVSGQRLRDAFPEDASALAGEGEVVAVLDTGLDYFHEAFLDRSPPWGVGVRLPQNVPVRGHRKVAYLGNHFGAVHHNDTRENGHGTAMCAAVAGSFDAEAAAAWTANPAGPRLLPRLHAAAYSGVAPAARLALQAISQRHEGGLDLPPTLGPVLEALYLRGARVFVMAFCGGGPRYAKALAAFARRRRDAVLVGAAGNHGVARCGHVDGAAPDEACGASSVCLPHTLPNALTVGAHRGLAASARDMGMAPYVLRFRCRAAPTAAATTVTVRAQRAQFSPYPPAPLQDVPVFWHPSGGKGCDSEAAPSEGSLGGKLARWGGHGGAAVADRGTCTFAEKAKGAMRAKAALLVVLDTAEVPDGPMQVEDDDTTQYLQAFSVAKMDAAAAFRGVASCDSVSGPFRDVGAGGGALAEDVLTLSGRGSSAVGGRVKPDVVAVGEGVLLPRANTSVGLIAHTGTSVATAMVGGAAAVLRGAVKGGVLRLHRFGDGGGLGAAPGGSTLGVVLASLVRGLVAHSATPLLGRIDLTGEGRYSSVAPTETAAAGLKSPFQGFGRVVLGSLFHASRERRMWIVEGTQAAGLSFTLTKSPGRGRGLVNVTLSWTDVGAGGARAGVAAPGGVARETDGTATLSCLRVPAADGLWTVRVDSAGQVGGRMEYALIVTVPLGVGVLLHNGSSVAGGRADSVLLPNWLEGDAGDAFGNDASLLYGHTRAYWNAAFFWLAAPAIVVALANVLRRRRKDKGA
eukprot:Rhum_TRINITY_DN12634_c0_g1::Rhum_TRINITY_DN12634_c0_g1_i1::g.53341::m.53341